MSGKPYRVEKIVNLEIQQQELKQMLLKMLIWFHDICVENGLKYYAIGGTMLGAARHQGFIP